MSFDQQHIFPLHNQVVQRGDKEALLGQRSVALWLTGLSGSGKTSIALEVEKSLHKMGIVTELLDGDNVRDGINKGLGFSDKDRMENVRRIAEINKLFVQCGIVTINCFVSPTAEIRLAAKEIIGAKDFLEVFVNTPLEVCEARDVKGLYAKARSGAIKNFTGIDAPFEAPTHPAFQIETENESIAESAAALLAFLLPKIKNT